VGICRSGIVKSAERGSETREDTDAAQAAGRGSTEGSERRGSIDGGCWRSKIELAQEGSERRGNADGGCCGSKIVEAAQVGSEIRGSTACRSRIFETARE
jgi:hypothetical protein